MPTIKKYTKVSHNNVRQWVKGATIAEIERDFKRYATTYKLAYGFYPPNSSLSTQLKEYTGITMSHLHQWVGDLEKS